MEGGQDEVLHPGVLQSSQYIPPPLLPPHLCHYYSTVPADLATGQLSTTVTRPGRLTPTTSPAYLSPARTRPGPQASVGFSEANP